MSYPVCCAVLLSLLVTGYIGHADTSGVAGSLDPKSSEISVDCPCLLSSLGFDVSSVEKIILEPEKILENPDQFWKDDDAYVLVASWHEQINQPPDLKQWQKWIKARCELSQLQRQNDPQLVAARKLNNMEKKFVKDAVPFLCSFLPPDADLNTTIYFTTDIIAAGFQQRGDIVIHILNYEILNLFVHEVFHRGFSDIYKKYVSDEIETDPMRLMYLSLQFEGMATYVAYKGLDIFPQIGEVGESLVATDYDLLSKPDEVTRLYQELYRLFLEAGDMEPDELRERAWQLGVRDRAYYVVGAYIAGLIDRELGRSALIETIKNGPASYVKAYNSFAQRNMIIPEP